MFPFRTTDINGLTIAYREKGQGDQHLIFVHGWASSSRMWNEALLVLADEYHCWAIDLVGFGDLVPDSRSGIAGAAEGGAVEGRRRGRA